MIPSENFDQLKLRFIDPIQQDYEVVRPIVLYSETVSQRSRETGIERTKVGEKAKRFVEEGMLGLGDHRPGKVGRKGDEYPASVAGYILYLKKIYPPLHYREIVRIVERKFGYKTNHHTVKDFLARNPVPVQLPLDIREFHQFEDAYQARWTVVQMYYQGWNKKSIAGCLKLSRKHVHHILKAFEKDGFAGLEDQRTRSVNHPHNQMTLPFLKEVLDIQKKHPRAGEFRVHGILENRSDKPVPSQRTVGRAMAINREFHDAPPAWRSDKEITQEDEDPKYLPYRPQYRHHIWYIDIRYLVKIEEKWIYSICVLEGYSRTILAGMASQYQDLASVLQILFAALSQYGCPVSLVSDNAAVFTSAQLQTILKNLDIEPLYIEKGKPWENLIEAQFKVQLRLADYKFETAQTFEDIQDQHALFVETFNTTRHFAHIHREDDRHTPMQVLDWVQGRMVSQDKLHRLFQSIRFSRTINRYGFISIQRFYIYAEQGLSRKRVSVWVYEGQLRIEYQQTMLAKYTCHYDAHRKSLNSVSQPTLFQTPFQSPQLVLFDLDDSQWLKIQVRTFYRKPKSSSNLPLQLPLPFPPSFVA